MLLDLAKADGEEPPALARKPKLTPWHKSFMDCFNTLSSSRNYTSAGPASIPYPFILSWLDEHNIHDLSEREEFVSVVQAIDNAYISHTHKKTNTK